MNATRSLCSLLFSSLLAAGCGGSSSVAPGSDSQPLVAIDVTLGSSGHPEFASFTSVVTSIGLVHAEGLRIVSVLPADTVVEWTGLVDFQRWLLHTELESGDYRGIFMTFEPDATRGVLSDGRVVEFETTPSEVVAPFDLTLSIADGGAPSVHLELDLQASIDLEGAPLFRPVGGASTELPSVPADTFFGLVRSVAAGGSIFLEAFADAEQHHPLGPLEVGLADDVLLVDDGGEVFESRAAFYGSLRPGLTLLELEGDIQARSRLRARRIEIIDPASGAGGTLPVRIEGKIAALESAGFRLMIRRILTGAEIAREVLAGLDRPGLIRVGVDDGTRILGSHDSLDPLRPDVGQSVVVEFREFVQEPFPADLVVLRRSLRCFSGVIAETPLLDTIALLLRPDTHPAGDPVRLPVALGDARISLLLRGRPQLRPTDLIPGMGAEACGEFRETDDARILAAALIHVHPGLFVRGDVAAYDRAGASFRTSTSRILQSFGTHVESGPLEVEIHEGARVHGVVSSVEGFFDLLDAQTDETRVFLGVKGIGGNAPNTVVAYALRVGVGAPGDSAD